MIVLVILIVVLILLGTSSTSKLGLLLHVVLVCFCNDDEDSSYFRKLSFCDTPITPRINIIMLIWISTALVCCTMVVVFSFSRVSFICRYTPHASTFSGFILIPICATIHL
jgi:hypothetical protein